MAKTADAAVASSPGVSTAPKTEFTIPINGSTDTLAYFDRHHAGVLSVHDVKVGIHELRLMKRFAVFLVILAFMLLIGTCGVTYLAVSLAKEMHVHNHHVVDTDGNTVATVETHETIHGVKLDSSRRLRSFTVSTNNTTSSVVLSSEAFYTTRDEYIAGKTDWIVDLPDGTVRTVKIQGMGSDHAWGLCGACDGAVIWQTMCYWDNKTDCLLDWHQSQPGSMARRADTFLARAGRTSSADTSFEEESADIHKMDRTLGGKCEV